MKGRDGYAVFFFPQALEALGEPIRPHLHGQDDCTHLKCRTIDTAGSLIELTLDTDAPGGELVDLKVMVPASMVRMIMSARSDEEFGFGPRASASAASTEAEGVAMLPPVGPDGAAAGTRTQAVPDASVPADGEPVRTPELP